MQPTYIRKYTKNPYVPKEPKDPKEPKENRRNRQSPPSLTDFFSASIIIKINPCSKEFAMMIPHRHGVGNVVAWGYHLPM
jgi:hypothetical protein